MRQCGAEWGGLTEEQKAPYVAKSQEDEKRYQAQIKMFNEKGYFLMQDGTKSTDHEVNTRKRKSAGTLANSPGKKRKSAHLAAKTAAPK